MAVGQRIAIRVGCAVPTKADCEWRILLAKHGLVFLRKEEGRRGRMRIVYNLFGQLVELCKSGLPSHHHILHTVDPALLIDNGAAMFLCFVKRQRLQWGLGYL